MIPMLLYLMVLCSLHLDPKKLDFTPTLNEFTKDMLKSKTWRIFNSFVCFKNNCECVWSKLVDYFQS